MPHASSKFSESVDATPHSNVPNRHCSYPHLLDEKVKYLAQGHTTNTAVHASVAKSCAALCDPKSHSQPGSSSLSMGFFNINIGGLLFLLQCSSRVLRFDKPEKCLYLYPSLILGGGLPDPESGECCVFTRAPSSSSVVVLEYPAYVNGLCILDYSGHSAKTEIVFILMALMPLRSTIRGRGGGSRVR